MLVSVFIRQKAYPAIPGCGFVLIDKKQVKKCPGYRAISGAHCVVSLIENYLRLKILLLKITASMPTGIISNINSPVKPPGNLEPA
jgi:hypothetical protein